MDEEKILELIQEAKDKMEEGGSGKPYAILCNRRTFEILAKQLRKEGIFREFDNIVPRQMWIEGLYVIKNEHIDDTQILVVDKNTYEQIMREKK